MGNACNDSCRIRRRRLPSGGSPSCPMKLETPQPQERTGLRLHIFTGAVLLVLALLTVRLVQMQLLNREDYTEEALANSVEQKIVEPARGLIYDRNGVLLVDNQPTYTI